MKLLSSFNTSFCTNMYEESKQRFGKDNILLIKRAYQFLLFQIIFPLIIFGFLIFMTIIFVRWITNGLELGKSYNIWLNIILIFLRTIIFGLKILKKFLDYKMDFTLINPDEITCVNQTGFFSRSVRTLESETIKSVTIPKTDFWQSLFNYGTLVFLAETEVDESEEDQGKGYIRFFWIHDVEGTREKILKIIESQGNAIRD